MAVLLVFLLALQISVAMISRGDSQSSCSGEQDHSLIRELQEAKTRIARLESVLQESMHDLNVKNQYLGECTKLIEEITHEIEHLESALFKDDSSHADEKLKMLEEEVRLLWDASRKNNFDLHALELKALDAEKRLNSVTSRTQTMADIVTEHWTQVQKLEQALQMTQMRASKVKRQLRFTRCLFLKFINHLPQDLLEKLMGMLEPYLYDNMSAPDSYLSRAWHWLKKTFSAAKYLHHQLQGYIMQEMERNEFTAAFANKEVVFFMASAMITFPILGAWMFLMS